MTATTNIAISTNLRTRARALINALNAGLYERDTAIQLAFLTAVAGESIFLLGPPGVGKSLIARRLKHAFADGTSFEYLMSKFSTPDEIFGPVSIKKLKDEDKYERLTDRYLPGANVVFLDEIWKAGPAIQNALLTILNEKIYRNGEEDIKVDIRGIITASNELPPRNQSLDPIWDRFLVRLEIGKIKGFQNFVDMIVSTEDVYEDAIESSLKLRQAELNEWDKEIDAVEVPPEVLNTIQLVMYKIEQYNEKPNNAERQIRIYDRRWKKIVRLLRTSAFLNGRNQVNLMDCFLLEHCLWGRPEHREVVREMVVESVRKHGYSLAINLGALKKEVNDFADEVRAETQIKNVVVEDQLLPVHDKYYRLLKESEQFKGELITIDQYRQLTLEEDQVINFYDGEKNLINRIKARKDGEAHRIVVNTGGTLQTYRLETLQKERTEIIPKPPHRVVAEFWDERCKKLNHYIEQQQERIAEQGESQLAGVGEHLFVEAAFAEVVRSNLEEVKGALEQLGLRLEKLRFGYRGVE